MVRLLHPVVVDVFQGDLSAPETLAEVMDGAVGLVIAAAPEWWRFGASPTVEGEGTIAAIKAAIAAGTVKRIVLLTPADGSPARSPHRIEAEAALKECGIPYVIVQIPMLSDEQGGMKNVIMRQKSRDSDVVPGKSLTRVDAAQIVCQSLVHAQFVDEMSVSDPDGGFFFGNCIIECSNGSEPSIIDRRYWKRQFADLDSE